MTYAQVVIEVSASGAAKLKVREDTDEQWFDIDEESKYCTFMKASTIAPNQMRRLQTTRRKRPIKSKLQIPRSYTSLNLNPIWDSKPND